MLMEFVGLVKWNGHSEGELSAILRRSGETCVENGYKIDDVMRFGVNMKRTNHITVMQVWSGCKFEDIVQLFIILKFIKQFEQCFYLFILWSSVWISNMYLEENYIQLWLWIVGEKYFWSHYVYIMYKFI